MFDTSVFTNNGKKVDLVDLMNTIRTLRPEQANRDSSYTGIVIGGTFRNKRDEVPGPLKVSTTEIGHSKGSSILREDASCRLFHREC